MAVILYRCFCFLQGLLLLSVNVGSKVVPVRYRNGAQLIFPFHVKQHIWSVLSHFPSSNKSRRAAEKKNVRIRFQINNRATVRSHCTCPQDAKVAETISSERNTSEIDKGADRFVVSLKVTCLCRSSHPFVGKLSFQSLLIGSKGFIACRGAYSEEHSQFESS